MPAGETDLPVSSSTPPDFLPDAVDCYRGALHCLREAEIPFAIAGAFALHKHTGIWRVTKDLDIILEARSVPNALAHLRQHGFSTQIEDPVWLAKAFRGDYFVDLITALGNAVLIVDSTWIDRAEPFTLFDVPCRVMAAEEIIASKIFVSRRERFDGADVAHLIRAGGRRLDWNRLRQILAGNDELLLWSLILFAYVYPAHVGLVPQQVWAELIQHFHDRVRHPDPGAPFRGTIIDPLMFAIDVNDWGERDLYREYCDRHPSLLEALQSPSGSRP
jgi:Nucleotidyl transferase of unknown function (DUF2204)